MKLANCKVDDVVVLLHGRTLPDLHRQVSLKVIGVEDGSSRLLSLLPKDPNEEHFTSVIPHSENVVLRSRPTTGNHINMNWKVRATILLRKHLDLPERGHGLRWVGFEGGHLVSTQEGELFCVDLVIEKVTSL